MRIYLTTLILLIVGCNYGCDQCVNSSTSPDAEHTSGGERMGLCPPTPTPIVIPPRPTPAPIAVVPSCTTACSNFRSMSCKEGNPTNDGATCESVCENMRSVNIIMYDLTCATKVTSCADISKCPRD